MLFCEFYAILPYFTIKCIPKCIPLHLNHLQSKVIRSILYLCRTRDGSLYYPVRPPPSAPKALRKMRGAFFLLCRIHFTEHHLSVKIEPQTLYLFCYLRDRAYEKYEKSVKQGTIPCFITGIIHIRYY